MPPSLGDQARRFYDIFAELVRRYQFRDREEVCCHGVSVSQCYALEALHKRGSMSMGELAEHLCLDLSTVTRVVDRLVQEDLVKRVRCSQDRRICRVELARRGRALVASIRGELVAGFEEVLRRVPAESREAVITAMSHLLSAFMQRQECGPAAPNSAGKRKQASSCA